MSVRTKFVTSVLTPQSTETIRMPSDMDCVLGSRHTGDESGIKMKVYIFLSRNLQFLVAVRIVIAVAFLKIDADVIFTK